MDRGRCDGLWIQHRGWEKSVLDFWPSVHVGYMSAFLEEVTCRHIMEDDSID